MKTNILLSMFLLITQTLFQTSCSNDSVAGDENWQEINAKQLHKIAGFQESLKRAVVDLNECTKIYSESERSIYAQECVKEFYVKLKPIHSAIQNCAKFSSESKLLLRQFEIMQAKTAMFLERPSDSSCNSWSSTLAEFGDFNHELFN